MQGGESTREDGATEVGELIDRDWIREASECEIEELDCKRSSVGYLDIPTDSQGGVAGTADDGAFGVGCGMGENDKGTVLERGRTVA
jgi:hypothetical protein